jgi:phosphonate transport system permease protein
LSEPDRPNGQPNGAPKRLADPLVGARSGAATLRLLLIAAVALAAHVYGWQITRINLVDLVTGLPNMQHIVAGLLQPDLVERVQRTATASAPLGLGCADPAPRVSTTQLEGASATLMTAPGCVQPGQVVTVAGQGFPSGREAQLFLVDPGGFVRRGPSAEVGPDGGFTIAFAAPDGSGEHTVQIQTQWPTGEVRPSDTLALAASKIVETLFLALMGTTVSVLLTVPLSFLGARNLMHGSRLADLVYYLTRTLFNILRSIEVLIIAVIMVVVVGIGPFAGVLAIIVHSIGALGKLYSEAIESIDQGPIEAITTTGASRLQVIAYAVVPQVIPAFLSFTMYRWDINVRMSTVIGLVGGGGIGYILVQYINLLQWHQAATAIWLITLVVMVLDFSSAYVRQRII